jgi:hypothetical protein
MGRGESQKQGPLETAMERLPLAPLKPETMR